MSYHNPKDKLPEGVKKDILKDGVGREKPKSRDEVTVDYVGTLESNGLRQLVGSSSAKRIPDNQITASLSRVEPWRSRLGDIGWSPIFGASSWLQWDLGSLCYIGALKVDCDADVLDILGLAHSSDGTNWTTHTQFPVALVVSQSGGIKYFSPLEARFIRLIVLAKRSLSISVEFYGSPQAEPNTRIFGRGHEKQKQKSYSEPTVRKPDVGLPTHAEQMNAPHDRHDQRSVDDLASPCADVKIDEGIPSDTKAQNNTKMGEGRDAGGASRDADLMEMISAMFQEKTSALSHHLDQEISIRQLENSKHCQEARMLSEKVAALSEDIAALRCDARSQANDITSLKERIIGFEAEIAAKEAHDMEVRRIDTVKDALEVARSENVALREQLALSNTLCPMLEETDLTSPNGKRIRLACPGVQAERLEIQPLANGVFINILPSVDVDHKDEPLFSKEFVYQCRGGFFQVSETECGIEDGVLVIVLRFVPRPTLKLGVVNRAPLHRIDEERGESSAGVHASMVFAVSPTPSLGTITTLSSENLDSKCDDALRVPSNLGPDCDSSMSSWINAKPDSANSLDGSDSDSSDFSLVESLGARSNSSARSTDSWISVSGPNCFTADSLFKIATTGAALLPARDLARGSRVMAADGKTILEVIKVRTHTTGDLLHLKAGDAELTVTGNHRMLVPPPSSIDLPPCHVNASKLQVGDSVLCQTRDGMNVMMELTEIFEMIGTKAGQEQQTVYEITFNPDEPVAVFRTPCSMILSKGFKKRKVHRGRNRGRSGPGFETLSVPDTAAGEYSE